MNIVPNTNIIIGLFIKCFFSFIIKNKSIIPSILYSINWILIFITSSYYLCLRNFFGWLSPYPIFLSFNFTRLLSLFSFLLPVLDLAILLLKNSILWFLLPIFLDVFLLLFHKPLFTSLKFPDSIPYVSVMVSHSLSHCDDVRYCTIPQIALPTISLPSVWQNLEAENSAHILMS